MEMKTWKHGEWRHEDMETWRHGILTFYEKNQIEDRKQKFSICKWTKWAKRTKQICPFMYGVISMFFERGLGGHEGHFFGGRAIEKWGRRMGEVGQKGFSLGKGRYIPKGYCQ